MSATAARGATASGVRCIVRLQVRAAAGRVEVPVVVEGVGLIVRWCWRVSDLDVARAVDVARGIAHHDRRVATVVGECRRTGRGEQTRDVQRVDSHGKPLPRAARSAADDGNAPPPAPPSATLRTLPKISTTATATATAGQPNIPFLTSREMCVTVG